MSVKGLNWAFDQFVPDPAAKLVLLVLANRWDHKTGVCYPKVEELAADASLSDRTTQRKLSWLEEEGFIERMPSFEDGRQRHNTYRLLLDRPDTRGDSLTPLDPRGDNARGDDLTPPETGDGAARGDSLTPHRGDTGVTLGGDTAVTPNNPHTNQKIPPLPPQEGGSGNFQTSEKGRQEGDSFGEPSPHPEDDAEFVAFWRDYPGRKVMDRERAYAVWLGLIPGKRKWAMYAAPKYAAELEKLKRKPIDAYKWLEAERFSEFPEARPVAPAPEPPRIFVPFGSVEWNARAVIACIIGETMPQSGECPGFGTGAIFRRGLPPDAFALADWAGDAARCGPWIAVTLGNDKTRQQFAAWRDRLREWTGKEPQPQRIDFGGIIERPVGDRVYEIPNVKMGFCVPRSWPPAKSTPSRDAAGTPGGGA